MGLDPGRLGPVVVARHRGLRGPHHLVFGRDAERRHIDALTAGEVGERVRVDAEPQQVTAFANARRIGVDRRPQIVRLAMDQEPFL